MRNSFAFFVRILVAPLCIIAVFNIASQAEGSDYFATAQISKDNNAEISQSGFIFFRRALQNLYSYVLQFESEIIPQLTSEEKEMWSKLKSLLLRDALARKQSNNGMSGLLKLALSSNQKLFEKPEGIRMAVTGASSADPIWINETLLASGREKMDYVLALQLLIHEIGHKLQNENIKAVYQISSLLYQKIASRMEKFEFKENVLKVFFIESDKIPPESLPHVDKNEILVWEEAPQRYAYYSMKRLIQIDRDQAKNLFYRTSILKEVFTNFKEDLIRFTIPFIKEFFYLKEGNDKKYQVESIIPQSNLKKYSLAHDIVLDISPSGINFNLENGTRLSLEDRFTVESMNLKTKFILIEGVLQVENLHEIYEGIDLNLEMPNNQRIKVPANKVEFLNNNMARVEFRLNLSEPSAFPTILINHITLKTTSREVRRILLPQELQWNRMRSQPDLPSINFLNAKPWYNPVNQDLTLEMQTDAKVPFLYFDLVFSNQTFFAEGDSERFNEHTPIHIIELQRIESKYIKQTLNEKGIHVSIKVPLIGIIQNKIFMPNFHDQADKLKSVHENVAVRIESDIAWLRFVDANLRTDQLELRDLPTISLYGVAKLNVDKETKRGPTEELEKTNEKAIPPQCKKLFKD